ncbi:MAG: hypothetical protein QW379_07970 [Thermoplasmata archaeon]
MPEKSKATSACIMRWRHYLLATRRNLQDFPDLKDELDVFERDIAAFERENQEQEKLKAELKAATQRVNAAMRELRRKEAALKRRWEAKYGPRSPKMMELEPATEGKLRKAPAVP